MSDEPEEKKKLVHPAIGFTVMAIPIALLLFFIIGYYLQETNLTKALDKCSFYTIAVPERMPTEHSLYFTFKYENKIHSGWTSVGAEDLGWRFSRSYTMKGRYWVQVHCTGLGSTRVIWDAKVPDTLQYIPYKGWKEIPSEYRDESD